MAPPSSQGKFQCEGEKINKNASNPVYEEWKGQLKQELRLRTNRRACQEEGAGPWERGLRSGSEARPQKRPRTRTTLKTSEGETELSGKEKKEKERNNSFPRHRRSRSSRRPEGRNISISQPHEEMTSDTRVFPALQKRRARSNQPPLLEPPC